MVSPPWESTSTLYFELEFLANNKITVDSVLSLLTTFSAILLFLFPEVRMVLKVRIFNMKMIQTKSWDKAAKFWTVLFMKSLKH